MFRVVFGALIGMAITPMAAYFGQTQISEWVLKNAPYQPAVEEWRMLFFFCTGILTVVGAIAGATQSIRGAIRRYRPKDTP